MKKALPFGDNFQVDVSYMYARALQLHAAGKSQDALELLQKALKLQPAHADLNHAVAAILVGGKNFMQAHDYVNRALLMSETPRYYNTLGVCQQNLGAYSSAEASYRRAIMLDPELQESTCNLADLYLQMQENEKVVELLESWRSGQDNPRALQLHAEALFCLHEFDAARKRLAQCLQVSPEYLQAYALLSRLEVVQGRVQKGIEHSRRLLGATAQGWQFFWLQGHLHLDYTGDRDKAVQLLGRAVSLAGAGADAPLQEALGRAMLARGDYRGGWSKYNHAKAMLKVRAETRQLAQHEWDGAALDGSNRLLAYSGKDPMRAVQMLRFVPDVYERAERVAILCDKPYAGLFANVPGVRAAFHGDSEVKFPTQYKVRLDELPVVLKSRDVTAPNAYLTSKGGKVPSALGRKKKGGAFRVGIAWSPEYLDNRRRYDHIPFAHFASLAGVMGMELYSLQRGSECSHAQEVEGITDLSGALDDALSLARCIEELDLVICADTVVAHLAGALGQDAWVVLPVAPDWVWQGGEQSEWYPTLRLFRQSELLSWDEPMQRVLSELRTRL